MKRRTAIKNSAFLLGGMLSASAVATIFNSCVAPTAGEVWTPHFLSVKEGQIVTRITDILIPTTDTPGAVDALVPQFIDRVLNTHTKPKQQEFVKAGFKTMEEACKAATGKSFMDCSAEESLTFLQAQEKEFIDGKGPNFFGLLKQTIYRGFFSSEEGATEVLMYDPVPGNYDGCIPYSEVNGTWAT